MFSRWEGPYSNWELDFKQCSFDRTVRILHHLPFNIFSISMLFTHALVPSAFRLQVSAMIQESPSKFFLTVSGILSPRHAAHRNRIQTVGVAIRQAVKKSGKSCLNGSGTSDWSWAINCSLIRCVPPSLLLLSRLRTRSPPNLPRRLLFRDTDRLLWLYPGKRAASRGKILSSNRMARFTVLQARCSVPMSGVERLMGACVWCMRPALAVVVPALYVSSVNGTAVRPRSRAR